MPRPLLRALCINLALACALLAAGAALQHSGARLIAFTAAQAAPAAGPATGAAKAPPALPVWPVTGGGPLRHGYSGVRLPTSGTIRWSITLPGAGVFGSSPVVDGAGRIFTVTNETLTSTPQSVVYCLDRGGNVLWSTQLSDEFEFQPVLLSSGTLLCYSMSKQLYAYSGTGELLWRRQYSASPRVGDREAWANYSSGALAPTQVQSLPDREGGVLVVDDSPALLKIDGSGKLRWTAPLYGSCAGGLMLLNGVVYVPACDGKLHVYSAATGKEQASLAVGGSVAFYPSGMAGGGVLAPVELNGGARVLLLPFPGIRGFEYPLDMSIRTPLTINAASQMLIAIGRMGSADGRVQPFSQLIGLTSEGKLAWSRDLNTLPAGPAIADRTGRFCFGTQDTGAPGVYQLDPQHGVEWWISTQGASTVFPIADGLLGVQVTSERPNVDKNSTLLMGIGA